MTQVNEEKLRHISNEELERILNEETIISSCGCGSDVIRNSKLTLQLTGLMATSETLLSVLGSFKAGIGNLTIKVDDLGEDTSMNTSSDSTSHVITINSRYINDEQGYYHTTTATDNGGFKHDGTISEREHDYFKKYEQDVFEDVRYDYRHRYDELND